MEFNLIGYENGKEVKVPIPFDEIVKQFWPYHNAPSKVAVSTSLGDDSAIAELPAYDGAKDSYPGIDVNTYNPKTDRPCSWFRIELKNATDDTVRGYLYGGEDGIESEGPLVEIVDGVRKDGDESPRVLWNSSKVHFEPMTSENFELRKRAVTKDQLDAVDETFNNAKNNLPTNGKKPDISEFKPVIDPENCICVYGLSDDLVEIENTEYEDDEIDCYDCKGVRLHFFDGTVAFVSYGDNGIWRIKIEHQGFAPNEIVKNEDRDCDAYSDILKIDADVQKHEIIY